MMHKDLTEEYEYEETPMTEAEGRKGRRVEESDERERKRWWEREKGRWNGFVEKVVDEVEGFEGAKTVEGAGDLVGEVVVKKEEG
ncbi:hypothetical protein RJT34_25201 [Clitoria ternatea]|uniref:Uncharacterized protein n=1 Tax=Clitoria ternatea TaxID=43366 RepID=A0AAN9FPH4_CLITE